MRERDSQQGRLYAAENRVRRKHGAKFKTSDEAREFINRVVHSKWWREQGYVVPDHIEIRFRKSGRFARGGGWHYVMTGLTRFELTLPKWAWQEIVILHELAHCVITCRPGGRQIAWHGYEFTQVLLAMVEHFVSAKARDALLDEFDKARVNVGERALELKEQGLSWREINARFGYAASGSGARAAANRAKLAAKRRDQR